MKIVFTCIVELLESDYNVTCPPGSVETAAGLYGPKLQSTIDMYHNVTKCTVQFIHSIVLIAEKLVLQVFVFVLQVTLDRK